MQFVLAMRNWKTIDWKKKVEYTYQVYDLGMCIAQPSICCIDADRNWQTETEICTLMSFSRSWETPIPVGEAQGR